MCVDTGSLVQFSGCPVAPLELIYCQLWARRMARLMPLSSKRLDAIGVNLEDDGRISG
jgi:hypothetical protein